MRAGPTMSHSPTQEPVQSAPLIEETATSDQRTYALIMHLSLLAIIASVPPVLAPLIMWLINRDSSRFIDDHGKEAVNFQLSIVLYSIVAGLAGVVTCGVGFFAVPVVLILGGVGAVMAAMAANRGEYHRYPATIRFIT